MPRRVVILGAGIAGLGAGLLLARAGNDVTIVERDGPPPTGDGDDAFTSWDRRSVPQWRQPHGFSTRSRRLLLERAPDVLDLLADDGVEDFNVVDMIVPAELRREDDDQFTGIMSRRPAFELALWRAVAAQPGARVLSSTIADGVVLRPGSPVRVGGLRLRDGTELPADVVLDCGGRRSPVTTWLDEAGVDVPSAIEDCETNYYTRYFREAPTFGLIRASIFAVRADLGYLMYIAFPGDHGTYGLAFVTPPWDDELKVLRHNWAWEEAARTMHHLQPWVDEANGTPINDVQVMAGHQNVRRYFVVDDRPVAVGLLTVGDALCTTNPAYGWGASMALTYAFAAVDALARNPVDVEAAALEYAALVSQEADSVFHQSATADRVRTCGWKGEPIPEADARAADEEDLVQRGVLIGARRDPDLLRAFLRRQGLLEPPEAMFADPVILEKAHAERDRIAAKPPPHLGPDRDELLALLDARRSAMAT